jgi:hypothetical protein
MLEVQLPVSSRLVGVKKEPEEGAWVFARRAQAAADEASCVASNSAGAASSCVADAYADAASSCIVYTILTSCIVLLANGYTGCWRVEGGRDGGARDRAAGERRLRDCGGESVAGLRGLRG